MSGDLGRDTKNNTIQGFAPSRIVTVTATVEWVPESYDRAFCVESDCTYQINATGLAGVLKAGAIRVIVRNQTYEFDTTQEIEVM